MQQAYQKYEAGVGGIPSLKPTRVEGALGKEVWPLRQQGHQLNQAENGIWTAQAGATAAKADQSDGEPEQEDHQRSTRRRTEPGDKGTSH